MPRWCLPAPNPSVLARRNDIVHALDWGQYGFLQRGNYAKAREIPFRVTFDLEAGPLVSFDYPVDDAPTFLAVAAFGAVDSIRRSIRPRLPGWSV